jgi:hypothetical protein
MSEMMKQKLRTIFCQEVKVNSYYLYSPLDWHSFWTMSRNSLYFLFNSVHMQDFLKQIHPGQKWLARFLIPFLHEINPRHHTHLLLLFQQWLLGRVWLLLQALNLSFLLRRLLSTIRFWECCRGLLRVSSLRRKNCMFLTLLVTAKN